jgi:hypothetical protein
LHRKPRGVGKTLGRVARRSPRDVLTQQFIADIPFPAGRERAPEVPDDELIQDHAECVYGRAQAGQAAGQKFGREVQRGTGRRGRRIAEDLGQPKARDSESLESATVERRAAAKVAEFDVRRACLIQVDQYVGGLQVLVQDAERVGGGERVSDLGRKSTGEWYVIDAAGHSVTHPWGASTDVPVLGDFDGDGKSDLAVFRPSTGYWYIVQSSNGEVVATQWGASSDIPVVGDFDGDGKSDIAVFRPSTGYWYIVQSSNGEVSAKQWGASTDIPVTGDFDGDGKTDIAVYRPSTGYWYIIQSSNGEVVTKQWGQAGDIPVARDYDGDSKTDIAVFRPSTGYWYVVQSSNGEIVSQQWGASSDIPVNHVSQ